ncbi:MAG TPA: hypothetical protein VK469_05125, partial [Candidatus Kapabacteria bacterium]|nr:hypothetical protein [Candidatus Kapabacteria bacterium]
EAAATFKGDQPGSSRGVAFQVGSIGTRLKYSPLQKSQISPFTTEQSSVKKFFCVHADSIIVSSL